MAEIPKLQKKSPFYDECPGNSGIDPWYLMLLNITQ